MALPIRAPSTIKHYMIMATKNNYTTLVSVRLDNDVLVNLDKEVGHLQYFSRSQIINNILGCVLSNTDCSTLGEIVRYNKYVIWKRKIKFERDI